jgi:hypothetical protein
VKARRVGRAFVDTSPDRRSRTTAVGVDTGAG